MLEEVKEMFEKRKIYTENKISELKEQVANHKSGHRSLEDSLLEGIHRDLKLHQQSLDKIVSTEDKEMERIAALNDGEM